MRRFPRHPSESCDFICRGAAAGRPRRQRANAGGTGWRDLAQREVGRRASSLDRRQTGRTASNAPVSESFVAKPDVEAKSLDLVTRAQAGSPRSTSKSRKRRPLVVPVDRKHRTVAQGTASSAVPPPQGVLQNAILRPSRKTRWSLPSRPVFAIDPTIPKPLLAMFEFGLLK